MQTSIRGFNIDQPNKVFKIITAKTTLPTISVNKVLIVEENVLASMALMTQFMTIGFGCDQAFTIRQACKMTERRLTHNETDPTYHLIVIDSRFLALIGANSVQGNRVE